VAVSDDPLREDELVLDEPEDLFDEVGPADEPVAAADPDDRPTTQLPRVTAPPAQAPTWMSGLAPWAVFGVVAVVVIAATSAWASWLRGPTDQHSATPRIAPVPTMTAPAAPTSEMAAPSPEPSLDPVTQPIEPPPTRERSRAPRAVTQTPPPPPARPVEEAETPAAGGSAAASPSAAADRAAVENPAGGADAGTETDTENGADADADTDADTADTAPSEDGDGDEARSEDSGD
jgi:hypothetical protein